jgi:O-antigen/teichoic acid export membrane protein
MSEMLRLGRNSLWLLVARVGAQALALFTIFLARKLGSVGFGEYAFFTTAIFIANVLSTCGTDMFFIREIAARDDLARLPAALWIQLFLSGLLIVGIVLGAPALPNQSLASKAALQVYSLTLIPLAFYSVFSMALRGKQRMDSYALLNFGSAVLQVVVVLLFVAGGDGVVTLAMMLLIAQSLVALLAGWMCTLQIAGFWRSWRFSWKDVQSVFAASASLGMLGMLGMFYQKLSLVLLSMLGGAALTGFFSAAMRVVEASKTVHLAVLTSLYPLMAQADPSGQVAGTIRLSWKLLLAGALALALGLSWLAAPLVDLLYGAGFAAATPILRILAWMLVPYTVNSFLTLAFVAGHRARAVGWALTASLLGLGLLSLWWIPAHGLEGVAWAALSAECLQAILLLAQTPEFQKLFRGEAHELSHLS